MPTRQRNRCPELRTESHALTQPPVMFGREDALLRFPRASRLLRGCRHRSARHRRTPLDRLRPRVRGETRHPCTDQGGALTDVLRPQLADERAVVEDTAKTECHPFGNPNRSAAAPAPTSDCYILRVVTLVTYRGGAPFENCATRLTDTRHGRVWLPSVPHDPERAITGSSRPPVTRVPRSSHRTVPVASATRAAWPGHRAEGVRRAVIDGPRECPPARE